MIYYLSPSLLVTVSPPQNSISATMHVPGAPQTPPRPHGAKRTELGWSWP